MSFKTSRVWGRDDRTRAGHGLMGLEVDLPRALDRGALTSVLHWKDEGSTLEILPFVCRNGDMMSTADVLERPTKALSAMRGVSVRAVTRQMQGMRHAALAITVVHEDSRGSVTLASADPTDMPVLKWNLLTAAADRVRFRRSGPNGRRDSPLGSHAGNRREDRRSVQKGIPQ